jgi:hypothetical protein
MQPATYDSTHMTCIFALARTPKNRTSSGSMPNAENILSLTRMEPRMEVRTGQEWAGLRVYHDVPLAVICAQRHGKGLQHSHNELLQTIDRAVDIYVHRSGTGMCQDIIVEDEVASPT